MTVNRLFCLGFMVMFLWVGALAQEVLVTERGDSILLHSDGTWEYFNSSMKEIQPIQIGTNSHVFTKPKSSKDKVNGKDGAYELWYNNKNWKRVPSGELSPDADLAFKLNRGDVYGMIIYEELEIELESLTEIALENARSAAPDIQLIEKEYREVNGNRIICMKMKGSMQGIKVVYYSYFFSNINGSIQFHTFTGQGVLSKYTNDIEDLLNGLIVKG